MSLESTNLSALLARLESATVRLETIAKERGEAALAAAKPGQEQPANAGNSEVEDDLEDDLPALVGFDDQIVALADAFLENSEAIGDVVAEQGKLVRELISLQRSFLKVASQSKRPLPAQYGEFLKYQEECIKAIGEVKDKNRRSPFFNHLSSIVDGIPAFGWVAVEKTPVPYIKDFKDSAQFYGNRVRKDAKNKGEAGEPEVKWVIGYEKLLAALADYVKQYHRTGLIWSPKGLESDKALEYIKKYSGNEEAGSDKPSEGPSSTAAPPPPPPPPPAGFFDSDSGTPKDSSKDSSQARTSLLSDLNRGSDITASLRKVDKSQMTHKNPNLRGSSVVSSGANKSTASATGSTPKATISKPPKLALEGKKWVVENYKNEQLTIDIEDIKYTVYIYNCTGCTIQIKNKLNTITVDNCKSTGVVFDSVLSEAVIINSRSIEMQVVNSVPAISIDKSDSISLYLSKETADLTTITSAKSSSINVSFPVNKVIDEEDVEENTELPIPEQIQTTVKDNKLVSVIYEHIS
ncbi:suppressor of rasval19 [Mycoemilia scoparia]|uniref:Adenylyl cyclase-associated protein n=1 Tax=Mycoemilia scoparia TaxID=417184 RepID=A0A9W8DT94_9FUNG|nr:suppressor of rasval19 [Mycoemilia scoparia]